MPLNVEKFLKYFERWERFGFMMEKEKKITVHQQSSGEGVRGGAKGIKAGVHTLVWGETKLLIGAF